MKILQFIFLLLLSIKAMANIEIKHSESASFLHFLDAGFNEPFTSGAMKEIIGKSEVFNDPDLKKEFENFKNYLQHGYNFHDEVKNRPEGFWAEDALTILAVNSNDLSSFEKQLSALLPYRGIASYLKVKSKTYSLFKTLIWEPSLRSQKNEQEKLEVTIQNTKFEDLLKKAKFFYRSDLPEEVLFKVGLVPIPDSQINNKHTNAMNLRDIQVVPYLLSKGAEDSLEVIFHEFCHALYEGQSKETKEEIDNFYLNHSDPHSIFVYRYLNEALATAWGNGWYNETQYGQLSQKSWYAVNYIDELAKAYLPLIKFSIENGKTLDNTFMGKTIEYAKKTFPNGPREIPPNFMAIRLLVDHQNFDLNSFKKELKTHFRIQSLKHSSPVDGQEWNNLTGAGLSNVVLITSSKNDVLKRIGRKTNILSFRKKVLEKKDFLIIVPQNKNYLFWISMDNQASFSKLLKKIKELPLLPERPTFISI